VDLVGNRVEPSPSGKFVCVTRPDGEQTVVSIIGDIDFATAQEVRDVLHNSYAVFGRPVVVDLRRVDFIDSAGVHVILNAQADADQQGFTMELSAPPTRLARAFATLGSVGEPLPRDWAGDLRHVGSGVEVGADDGTGSA
jgi:anti-sigma B factor antagonist